MKFSLLSYNIHKGFSQSKRFILPELKTALVTLNPDILCLQELQGEHRKLQEKIVDWPEEEQIEYLSAESWPHYIYGKNTERRHSDHGNGISSKFPIMSAENFDISSSIFSSRGLLHAIIEPGDTRVHVLCTHLGLLNSERVAQFRDLSVHIQEKIPQDEPLIMAGDFNDWRLQADQHFFEDLNLQEVFTDIEGRPAKTFPSIKPLLAVDRIYYRNLIINSCAILDGDPWSKLSDHLPLWVEFSIKPRKRSWSRSESD